MNSFTLYAVKNGVQWYRCNCCMNLTRGKPEICPVCKGESLHTETDSTVTNEAFEKSLQKLKDMMKKYENK